MEISPFLISDLERMLKYCCHNSSNTEWRLNNARNILFFHHIYNFLFKLNVLFSQHCVSTFNGNLYMTVSIKLFLQQRFCFLVKIFKIGSDSLRIFFELLTNHLSLECNGRLLFWSWLFESPRSKELHAWTLCMLSKIISGSVCTTDYLKPSRRKLRLSVPTILGVMGHLIGHMLSKS